MFIELLRKRRSIRRYEDRQIEDEKVQLLVEAALRSPSSRGLNPWEFIVVRDRAALEALSRAKPHGSGFLKGAPLGIVVCADPQRADTWVEDTSIASIIIQLQAEDLGLGSCWVQIRMREHDSETSAEDYVKKVLGLPEHLRVESIIAIGYPAERKPGHPKEALPYEKIHYERF
ncbi:MAG: NAD(P)H-dependent dehydrogenase/reductase [Nitrospirae bacterium]|nr:MAG: NAD(P)H-dependent dehydrogenase/reductase [Nitrospirota bacterium]